MPDIPFLNFASTHAVIKAEMEAAFQRVYDSNWFILGQEVAAFEQEYAQYNQAKHAIGVSNGLDALILSLKVLGIGPGDEVIVPSNTYIATVLAITHVGATPVFVEPRMETYNINPELIEAAITKHTKAIMPVHLYGQPCEMDALMARAEAHNLKVVEDNAQAHGATWQGRKTGSFGHCNGTSFYPGKNLGALGDGGTITTDDAAIAEQAAIWRNYGSKDKYYNEVPGFNNRLDELQAAFLRVKLRYLDEWTKQRKQIAHWYDEALANIPGITKPNVHPDASHSYHLYVIRTQNRNTLQAQLKAQGIDTLIHYPIPPHLQNAYKYLSYKEGDFPIAEEMAKTLLSLPIWPGMNQAQIITIVDSIRKYG